MNAPLNVSEPSSWISKLSHIGTSLFTMFSGVKVGEDKDGNIYYRERKTASKNNKGIRERRWVMYNGRPEASRVPAEWHGWLHYTEDQPMPADSAFHQPWEKPHQPNMTFSNQAYFPPGHDGGKRDKATGDYQAWKPKN